MEITLCCARRERTGFHTTLIYCLCAFSCEFTVQWNRNTFHRTVILWVFKYRAAVRLTLLPRLPSLPILPCLQPHTLKPLWDSTRIISYLRSTSVVPINALGDSWSVGRTIPTVKTSLSSKSPVRLHWLHPLFLLLHLSWSKSGCLLKVLSWLMYPYSLQDYFLLSLTVCIPIRALRCSLAVM